MTIENIKAFQLDVNDLATTLQTDVVVVNAGLATIPTSNQVITKIITILPYSFPANMVGSFAVVDIAPTATAVFSLSKNGVQFANITVDVGTTDGRFAGAPTSFSVGDAFTVTSPGVVDATLKGVWVSLKGVLI